MRILVAVATYNRPRITEICLKNLAGICSEEGASLVIYDDCSTIYGARELSRYSSMVVVFPRRVGIEISRARAFRDFVHVHRSFDLLYLTDNDTLHDPAFLRVLRDIFLFQSVHSYSNPVGLFRSRFHEAAITAEAEGFVMSRTCPGVSQCYTREMAERIVSALDHHPTLEYTYGWDYHYPSVLQTEFVITLSSYVQHFARDRVEGGIHATNGGVTESAFRKDFARDSAMNPTKFLMEMEDTVIQTVLDPQFLGLQKA